MKYIFEKLMNNSIDRFLEQLNGLKISENFNIEWVILKLFGYFFLIT